MRRYHSWLAALGIAAATPGLALAGPFGMFSGGDKPASADAKAVNDKLANDVAKALYNAKLAGNKITVECRNGEAKLIGEVPTEQLRATAERAAEMVPGVRVVTNDLTVKSQGTIAKAKSKGPAMPGAEMAARPVLPKRQPIQQVQHEERSTGDVEQENQARATQIASALEAVRFSGDNIEIRFIEGVASISGSVDSVQQRNQATSIISRVPGVKKVDNQLEVHAAVAARPTARPQTSPRTAARSAARQPIRQVQFDESMAAGGAPMDRMGMPPIGPGGNGYPINPAAGMMQGGPGPSPINGMPMTAANPAMYDQPNLPSHAWPAYASYPNYAAVTYPKQYSASAWPYIGPFYPYPQVPLGWRKVQLEWDDGYWQLNFRPRTDRWWWFVNPQNW